jgi:mannose-1-phosphate guanylyltransferase
MLAELENLEPGLIATSRTARDQAHRAGDHLALGEAFLKASNIAIDVAVMERTRHAAVLPVDYAWSDLGAWDAVLEAAARDPAGNAIQGRVVSVNTAGCLIRADAGTRVVAIGLKGIAIVVEGGLVLVCDLASVQQVKSAGQAIEEDSG